MRIGFIGLGKLGMPVAAAFAYRGVQVVGYDKNPETQDRINNYPFQETALAFGFDRLKDLLKTKKIEDNLTLATSIADVLASSPEVVFLAIQTPHGPEYEGVTPIPATRADFDYSHVHAVLKEIVGLAKTPINLVLISTMLPGTFERELRVYVDQLPSGSTFTYNPYFIAMGNVVDDLLNPEFLLIGTDGDAIPVPVHEAYRRLFGAHAQRGSRAQMPEMLCMDVTSAEMCKVAYNTFISTKIAMINSLASLCEATGADVDQVTRVFTHATTRLLSPCYLRAGMGDGGGCHPRDNIALSWLAREQAVSYDFFGAIMEQREKQASELARWLEGCAGAEGLPAAILGVTFKKGTNILTGSHALLVAHFCEAVDLYDWHCTEQRSPTGRPIFHPSHILEPHVFLIGIDHPEVRSFNFPQGSIVIDPCGIVEDQKGIVVTRVGRR